MACAVRLLFGLAWIWLGSPLFLAQAPPGGGDSQKSALPSLPGAQVSGTNAALRTLPPPPGTKTPADTFRELLAMTPTEQDQALASRSEPNRKYVESQLRYYQSLPPELREARLNQLQLRCHLEVLMKLAPTNRAERLEAVPPNLRPVIDERLKEWDRLAPDVQKDAIDYDTTVSFLLRVKPADSSAPDPASGPPPLPLAPVDGKRRKAIESFNEFFELPAKEQVRTLDVLAPAERDEMEKTLEAFKNLPQEQRKTCIESFDKLNHMTKDQRDQFFKAAERWKAMTPRERETWRTLLKILPPSQPTSPASRLPPGATSSGGAMAVSNPPSRTGTGN